MWPCYIIKESYIHIAIQFKIILGQDILYIYIKFFDEAW